MSLLSRCIRCLGSKQILTLGNIIIKCGECLGIGFKEIKPIIEEAKDEIEHLVEACEKKFKKADKDTKKAKEESSKDKL